MHPCVGTLLDLGTDGCWTLHPARVPTIAGPPTSCLVKRGPGFPQTLTGLRLTFTLPRFPHRTMASGRSLLQPEQCRALATEPGPSRPANSRALSLTLRISAGFPHPRLLWEKGLGAHPHTLISHFGSAKLPLTLGRKGSRCDPAGLNYSLACPAVFLCLSPALLRVSTPLGLIPVNAPRFNLT